MPNFIRERARARARFGMREFCSKIKRKGAKTQRRKEEKVKQKSCFLTCIF
jgi:hypothetical protein